jgi:hypothetical protein
MKKINQTMEVSPSIKSFDPYLSQFEYFISGNFGNNRQISIKNDLPSDFLEKEQIIEKEFDITDGPSNITGKYKAVFFNSIEHYPKRKVALALFKYRTDVDIYEVVDNNINFFEGTKFFFLGHAQLAPKNILALGVSHKNYFE